MSEDEKGFLVRWSQRKRDAAKAEEPKPAEPPEETKAAGDAPPPEGEPPFDLESLPKLDDITANTDMTVFFKKGVPESIRNAALRKSWALDPAIRNYVNPALDYAYDWNAPGGVPGGGELAPGTNVARMVAQVFGQLESASPVEKSPATPPAADASPMPTPVRQQDATPQGVRVSDAAVRPSSDLERSANVAKSAETPRLSDAGTAEDSASATQQQPRRHGSARPK